MKSYLFSIAVFALSLIVVSNSQDVLSVCSAKITHEFTIICYYTGTHTSSYCYNNFSSIISGAETTTTSAISGNFVRCCVDFTVPNDQEPPGTWTHEDNPRPWAEPDETPVNLNTEDWAIIDTVLEFEQIMDYTESQRIIDGTDHGVFFSWTNNAFNGGGAADWHLTNEPPDELLMTEGFNVPIGSMDPEDAMFAHEHGHMHGLFHEDQNTWNSGTGQYEIGDAWSTGSGNMMRQVNSATDKLLDWQCEGNQWDNDPFPPIGIVEN